MAQVLKLEVRERICAAALACFAELGYERTTLTGIAREAGTAVANLYRYYPSKEALLAEVVPPELPAQHDELLEARVAALSGDEPGPAATDLLDFWLEHRLAVAVLLDGADGSPYAGYPQEFVGRLVRRMTDAVGRPLTAGEAGVVHLVFDNTRRAIAQLLRSAGDREELAEMVAAFWSYQVPGLEGLLRHLRAG